MLGHARPAPRLRGRRGARAESRPRAGLGRRWAPWQQGLPGRSAEPEAAARGRPWPPQAHRLPWRGA
eukprot:8268863-Alexandrium_andersonii.AAC.1